MDDGSTIYYSTDNSNWSAYTGEIPVTANGTYYFKATDAAGNEGTNSITFSNIDTSAPVITLNGDTTTPAQSATLTASVDDGSTIYYSTDNSNWSAYTGEIPVTANGTYYFKAADAAGNVGTNSITFGNIDRTAPAAPTIQASTTAATNQNVTLTATYSNDTATKQYSTDNKTWKSYSSAITVSANATYYFRGIDAAGNISEVTEYAVSNIITALPDSVTGDLNGDGRADIVMSITEAGHSAEGATGAWLIQKDQTPVWGDLSTRNSGWEIFGTGKTAAGKNTDDVYIRSNSNIIGAWTTGDDGKVNGWETLGEFSSDAQILGLGDFNGNGQSDLLLRNINGAVGCFFTGGEKSGWKYFQSLGNEWKLSAIGDLNGDGRDDVVLKHDAGFAGSWLIQKDGTPMWADLDTLPDGFEIVGAGDFNGDGTDDVLLKNGSYYGAWLVKNGNATGWMGLGDFGDAAVEQIADFNDDGKDDLRIRTSAGDLGVELVMGADNLSWKYYGSVGSEWSTSLAVLS